MSRPFREHHVLTILEEYDRQTLPLDHFVSTYFRDNKALGSKDRGFISETVFTMIRWRGLLEHAVSENSWEKRLELFLNAANFDALRNDMTLPPHIRLSFPQALFDELVRTHGFEKTCEICAISNSAAPTTIRVNILKTTREQLLETLRAQQLLVAPCPKAANGILFAKRVNFYELEEFKNGLFEVQDEGSQLVADLMQPSPGQLALDYCAGAGGKTLAFAPRMQNSGQIYVHDIRKHVLLDCRKRLKRAGIQNTQMIHEDDAKLKKLKKKMDWVLVDAPCSGTGTLRRNPDMKWRYTPEMLTQIIGQQRVIFEKALSFLKPNGRIVYVTCSILGQENDAQIAHFEKTYNLELEKPVFQSLPEMNGMDGFYGAVFVRKS